MTYEPGRSDDIIADYVRSGWRVLDPRTRRPDIDFVPDYLLAKGDDYLVVEVKRRGSTSDRTVAETRRIVENQPHWHFAVKLQPFPSPASELELSGEDIHARLGIARDLLASGHDDEAILIAWAALAGSLRRLVSDASVMPVDPALPAVLRSAYEAEVISESELRQIEDAKFLRNRIVQGFRAPAHAGDAKHVLALTTSLADRVKILDSEPSPSPSP